MRPRKTSALAVFCLSLSASCSSRDLENPQGATLSGHGDRVVSLAFSPDSKSLASASEDGTIKV
jgi:WD40 repeat protein